jgi:hypothetical protein
MPTTTVIITAITAFPLVKMLFPRKIHDNINDVAKANPPPTQYRIIESEFPNIVDFSSSENGGSPSLS